VTPCGPVAGVQSVLCSYGNLLVKVAFRRM